MAWHVTKVTKVTNDTNYHHQVYWHAVCAQIESVFLKQTPAPTDAHSTALASAHILMKCVGKQSVLPAHNDEYSESTEPTICFGDDETSAPTDALTIFGDDEGGGPKVGDMGSYICVGPTPSTETPAPTDAPGCCYGDGYKTNGMCARATTQSKCEDMGCSFLVMSGECAVADGDDGDESSLVSNCTCSRNIPRTLPECGSV